jgi:hypothetical protein
MQSSTIRNLITHGTINNFNWSSKTPSEHSLTSKSTRLLLSVRDWDLMSWVKQCNLPHMESILFRDELCNTLDSLWNALHSTYNAALGHECEMESLNEFPAFLEREWLDFTPNKVCVTLAACAKFRFLFWLPPPPNL